MFREARHSHRIERRLVDVLGLAASGAAFAALVAVVALIEPSLKPRPAASHINAVDTGKDDISVRLVRGLLFTAVEFVPFRSIDARGSDSLTP